MTILLCIWCCCRLTVLCFEIPKFLNPRKIAIALDFFLGGLGHRFYLGTETLTGLAYIFTCGGIFGIVPLVDLIVLIIDNKDISAYINNPKFFMWN
jgi:TM2 domain-containing membrane protein YozV